MSLLINGITKDHCNKSAIKNHLSAITIFLGSNRCNEPDTFAMCLSAIEFIRPFTQLSEIFLFLSLPLEINCHGTMEDFWYFLK